MRNQCEVTLDCTAANMENFSQGYTLVAPNGGAVYAAFIAVTGPIFVEATAVEGGFSVTIPEGFAGQTYVVLTSCNDTVNDDTVAAGPAIIEVGHNMIRLLRSV